MQKTAFIPNVKPDTVSSVAKAPVGTCFIMEQRQPADMWDPEDNLDLVPYSVWSRGTEEQINKYWQSLIKKIERASENERVDIFCRTYGAGWQSIVLFKGSEVIVYTACDKDKALQLAF